MDDEYDLIFLPIKILMAPFYLSIRSNFIRDRNIAKIILFCIMDLEKNNSLFQQSINIPKYHTSIFKKKNTKTYTYKNLKLDFNLYFLRYEEKHNIILDRNILKKNILSLAKKYEKNDKDFNGSEFIDKVLNLTPKII